MDCTFFFSSKKYWWTYFVLPKFCNAISFSVFLNIYAKFFSLKYQLCIEIPETWFSMDGKEPIAYAKVEVIEAIDMKPSDLNG